MHSLQKSTAFDSDLEALDTAAIDFLTAGVGCNCLIAIEKLGVLELLTSGQGLALENIPSYPNPACLESALITLEKCNLVYLNKNKYKLTDLGKSTAKHIGLFKIFFSGYGDLVNQQEKLITGELNKTNSLMKEAIIAEASTEISDSLIDPLLIQELALLDAPGTICDLGCGLGKTLQKICQETNRPGIGIDLEAEVIQNSKQPLKGSISIEVGDIRNLHGTWEDVSILLQCYVFHDFVTSFSAEHIFRSLLTHFPNLQYFIYVDAVKPSSSSNDIFPGFDYVHGLQGIHTPTYEETLAMFKNSNYKVIKEVRISIPPNSFLWVLSPTLQDSKHVR